MALYDFATRRADLQSKFNADTLGAEQGRFVGQQRFGRQRQEMSKGFRQSFPRFTGQWAGRLGSGVKSGVFGQQLGRQIGDFRQRMADVDVGEAQFLGGVTQQDVLRRTALENALRALSEEEQMYRLRGMMQ
jgi:hypothetical protein